MDHPPSTSSTGDDRNERLIKIFEEQINFEIASRMDILSQINTNIELCRQTLVRLRKEATNKFYMDFPKKDKVQHSIHPAVKKLIGKRPAAKSQLDQYLESDISKWKREIRKKQRYSPDFDKKIKNTSTKISEENSNSSDEECNTTQPRYIPPTIPGNPQENSSFRGNARKMHMRVLVGNMAKQLDNATEDSATHKWMVYVRSAPGSLSIEEHVSKVRFFLHPSYKPHDIITVPGPPFTLHRRGWGEFPMKVQLFFKNHMNKSVDIIHILKLTGSNSGRHLRSEETFSDLWIYPYGNDCSGDQHSPSLPRCHKCPSTTTCTCGDVATSTCHSEESDASESEVSLSGAEFLGSINIDPLADYLIDQQGQGSPPSSMDLDAYLIKKENDMLTESNDNIDCDLINQVMGIPDQTTDDKDNLTIIDVHQTDSSNRQDEILRDDEFINNPSCPGFDLKTEIANCFDDLIYVDDKNNSSLQFTKSESDLMSLEEFIADNLEIDDKMVNGNIIDFKENSILQLTNDEHKTQFVNTGNATKYDEKNVVKPNSQLSSTKDEEETKFVNENNAAKYDDKVIEVEPILQLPSIIVDQETQFVNDKSVAMYGGKDIEVEPILQLSSTKDEEVTKFLNENNAAKYDDKVIEVEPILQLSSTKVDQGTQFLNEKSVAKYGGKDIEVEPILQLSSTKIDQETQFVNEKSVGKYGDKDIEVKSILKLNNTKGKQDIEFVSVGNAEKYDINDIESTLEAGVENVRLDHNNSKQENNKKNEFFNIIQPTVCERKTENIPIVKSTNIKRKILNDSVLNSSSKLDRASLDFKRKRIEIIHANQLSKEQEIIVPDFTVANEVSVDFPEAVTNSLDIGLLKKFEIVNRPEHSYSIKCSEFKSSTHTNSNPPSPNLDIQVNVGATIKPILKTYVEEKHSPKATSNSTFLNIDNQTNIKGSPIVKKGSILVAKNCKNYKFCEPKVKEQNVSLLKTAQSIKPQQSLLLRNNIIKLENKDSSKSRSEINRCFEKNASKSLLTQSSVKGLQICHQAHVQQAPTDVSQQANCLLLQNVKNTSVNNHGNILGSQVKEIKPQQNPTINQCNKVNNSGIRYVHVLQKGNIIKNGLLLKNNMAEHSKNDSQNIIKVISSKCIPSLNPTTNKVRYFIKKSPNNSVNNLKSCTGLLRNPQTSIQSSKNASEKIILQNTNEGTSKNFDSQNKVPGIQKVLLEENNHLEIKSPIINCQATSQPVRNASNSLLTSVVTVQSHKKPNNSGHEVIKPDTSESFINTLKNTHEYVSTDELRTYLHFPKRNILGSSNHIPLPNSNCGDSKESVLSINNLHSEINKKIPQDILFIEKGVSVDRSVKESTIDTQVDYFLEQVRLLVNTCKFENTEFAVRWLVRGLPLVHSAAKLSSYKMAHPYCAPTLETFSDWPYPKQAACEWLRAKTVARLLQALMDKRSPLQDVWSTKTIFRWARFHGYSPTYIPTNTGTILQSECNNKVIQQLCEKSSPSKVIEWIKSASREGKQNIIVKEQDIDVVTLPTSTGKRHISEEVDPGLSALCGTSWVCESHSRVARLARSVDARLGLEPLDDEGTLAPVAATVLTHLAMIFTEDLMRRSFSASCKRGAAQIEESDVYKAVLDREEFDIFSDTLVNNVKNVQS